MLRTSFAARSLAIVAVALLACLSPAAASGVPMVRLCALAADVERGALAAPGLALAWFAGRDLERILAAYNAEPPPSSLAADRVMIATDRKTGERLFFFRAGCLVEWNDMPLGWSRRALGEGV